MGLKPRAAKKTRAPSWNQALAERVRVSLGPRPDVFERRMFGGLCFMVGGHMTVGLVGDKLMARVGPDQYDAALKSKHVRPMDFTGRPLTGFVYVEPSGLKNQTNVASWVDRCLAFIATLPKR